MGEQLKEEQRMRKHHEHIIQQQRLEIERLASTVASSSQPTPPSPPSKKAKVVHAESPTSENHEGSSSSVYLVGDGDGNNLREQLIKSRRKQLELVRVVEGWKQKAMELKSKLAHSDSTCGVSKDEISQIAEQRRLQTAEQLLKMGMSSAMTTVEPVQPKAMTPPPSASIPPSSVVATNVDAREATG